MQTVNVDIQEKNKKYPIFIGSGAKEFVSSDIIESNKILVVTNKTIFKLYEKIIENMFSKVASTIEYCILKDGEIYKNQDSLEKILNTAFAKKFERQDTFVAFGGGVIGDMTGFAAAIYLRGINFIQIPTTLLACTDSSVGGKVGINNNFGKNLLGAFYQPKAVIADLEFLKTLPKEELIAGLAEVVKYSFIEKSCGTNFDDFAKFLSKNSNDILNLNMDIVEKLVKRCCELKASVVSIDEKEAGLRAILNFGHTIAHALEKLTDYNYFLHGEAVSIGMKIVFLISYKLNKITKDYFDFAQNLMNLYEFNFKIPENITPEKIYETLTYDKKVQNGKVRFVLPVDYGKVEITDNVDKTIILDSIKEFY